MNAEHPATWRFSYRHGTKPLVPIAHIAFYLPNAKQVLYMDIPSSRGAGFGVVLA
jgi:hypothetical protein